MAHQRGDGTWDPDVEYAGIPHAYNARVAWALLRLAATSGDERFSVVARRQLDWVVERQADNGWFGACIFKPGGTPSTHGIAYTMRGLLESHCLTGERAYLDSAVAAAEALMRKLEVHGYLPANYDSSWAAARWARVRDR